MKTFHHQELDAVNMTRSNIFGLRGQFTPEFKPLEFKRLGNYGKLATIESQAGKRANWRLNSLEFDRIRNQRKP